MKSDTEQPNVACSLAAKTTRGALAVRLLQITTPGTVLLLTLLTMPRGSERLLLRLRRPALPSPQRALSMLQQCNLGSHPLCSFSGFMLVPRALRSSFNELLVVN